MNIFICIYVSVVYANTLFCYLNAWHSLESIVYTRLFTFRSCEIRRRAPLLNQNTGSKLSKANEFTANNNWMQALCYLLESITKKMQMSQKKIKKATMLKVSIGHAQR